MAGGAVWARYQFLEDLWRGQDRIVFDPALEEALRVGGPGLGNQSHPALTALSDALIPREVAEESVWFALANPRRAAEYARLRAGTTFVGLDEAAAVATDEDWQVALVDLGGMLAEAGSGAEESLGATARLEARLAALLEVLAERASQGRSIVITVPSAAAGGLDYDTFSGLLAELFPLARVYGVGSAEAALVFDFGEVEGAEESLELADDDAEDEAPTPVAHGEDREAAEYEADLDAAEVEWTDHGVGDEDEEGEVEVDAEDEDVPVDYDNSLGDEEPEIGAWVAVLSRRALVDGLTVIELPSEPSPGPGPRDSALRVQLAQVQRQADLAAIERQRLAEQLDEAEERIAVLAEEREQLLEGALDRQGDPASVTQFPGLGVNDPVESAARLDAALSREQALRWELSQLRAELEQARARPVDELEAQLASARAELDARTMAAADDEPVTRGPVPVASVEGEFDDGGVAETVFVFTESAPIPAESPRIRSEVDRLLRRIERGGMPTVELHRALKRLRGFFRG